MSTSFHISDGRTFLGPYDMNEVELLVSRGELPGIAPVLISEAGNPSKLASANEIFKDLYKRYHGHTETITLLNIATKAASVSAKMKPCYWVGLNMESSGMGPFTESLLKKLILHGLLTGTEKVLYMTTNGDIGVKEHVSDIWPSFSKEADKGEIVNERESPGTSSSSSVKEESPGVPEQAATPKPPFRLFDIRVELSFAFISLLFLSIIGLWKAKEDYMEVPEYKGESTLVKAYLQANSKPPALTFDEAAYMGVKKAGENKILSIYVDQYGIDFVKTNFVDSYMDYMALSHRMIPKKVSLHEYFSKVYIQEIVGVVFAWTVIPLGATVFFIGFIFFWRRVFGCKDGLKEFMGAFSILLVIEAVFFLLGVRMIGAL